MSEQIELFPVGDYTDRLYYTDFHYLPTSVRTKRPLKKGRYPAKRSAPNPNDQNHLGT